MGRTPAAIVIDLNLAEAKGAAEFLATLVEAALGFRPFPGTLHAI